MSEIKLKPCPFCGGEAKYISFTQGLFIQRFVTCTKCGIETPRNCLNRKDAIKRWNIRTPMDNIVEKLEEELLTSESAHAEAVIGMCGVSASGYSGEISAYTKAINIMKQEIDNGLE